MFVLFKNYWIRKMIALLILKIVLFTSMYYLFYKKYQKTIDSKVVTEHIM